MDVILIECNLSLHEIPSVFQSAVIFMNCRIMELKICIFRQHFFVNANFIKHNRHFMSTYFLLDPFEFPYYFYPIRGESIYVLSIVVCIPSTFCPTLKKICRHKMSMFNEICINEEMIYIAEWPDRGEKTK